eukprot:1818566-Pyramimonas_sp.AAC.1
MSLMFRVQTHSSAVVLRLTPVVNDFRRALSAAWRRSLKLRRFAGAVRDPSPCWTTSALLLTVSLIPD